MRLDRGYLIAARLILAPPSTLFDAVMTLPSALSYRTQSWSISKPIPSGLNW
jgi:hypothetical protein